MQIPFKIDSSIRKRRMFTAACGITARLRSAGFSAYLVGGAVRDLCLGKIPKDFDITTDAEPAEIMRLFPESIPLGASFGVVTVVADSMHFEVATFREERNYEDGRRPEHIRFSRTPQEDVARRDFTINAMLLDPETEILTDHTGGYEDLRRGILRTIGDPVTRFSEDYLRMLRALRFTVRLQLTPDESLMRAIELLAPKLRYLSAERVRDEFTRILCGPSPDRAFRMAAQLGVLKELLPEVDALRGVEQPKEFHPEGDVFEHTMQMLSHMAFPSPELGWSILLHDAGKPACRGVREDGRIHFHTHEEKGAEIAEQVMRRLKMRGKAGERIVSAVRNHMRFAQIDKMRTAKWRRLAAEENFPLELELHRIDCISCHGKLGNYLLLLDRLHELEISHAETLPAPFLKGGDILALGIPPGPKIGFLLKYATDLQLDGIVSTKEEALNAVKNRLIHPSDV